jgi:hypothetical protein
MSSNAFVPSHLAKSKAFAVVLLALASCTAHADTIAQWTFQTSVPTTAGPYSPETGSGSATAFHASSSTVYSNPSGNGSTESWSSTNWAVGDYWQFQVSTVGFQDIQVSFDQTSSSGGTSGNGGPRDFKLAYSIDGSAFTDFQNYAVSAYSWSSGSTIAASQYAFDLSAIISLQNSAAVYLRLVDTGTVSAGGGTVASSGTNRVDNFTVTGTAIPANSVPDSLPAGFVGIVLLGLWASS